jgi:hypothetical protein
VEPVCEHLLAGPRRTTHEDREPARGDLVDLAQELEHRLAAPDDLVPGPARRPARDRQLAPALGQLPLDPFRVQHPVERDRGLAAEQLEMLALCLPERLGAARMLDVEGACDGRGRGERHAEHRVRARAAPALRPGQALVGDGLLAGHRPAQPQRPLHERPAERDDAGVGVAGAQLTLRAVRAGDQQIAGVAAGQVQARFQQRAHRALEVGLAREPAAEGEERAEHLDRHNLGHALRLGSGLCSWLGHGSCIIPRNAVPRSVHGIGARASASRAQLSPRVAPARPPPWGRWGPLPRVPLGCGGAALRHPR